MTSRSFPSNDSDSRMGSPTLPRPFLLRLEGKDYLWGENRLNDDFSNGIGMMPLRRPRSVLHTWMESAWFPVESLQKKLSHVMGVYLKYLGTHSKTACGLPILIKLIDAQDWHYEALNQALGMFGMEISRYEHLHVAPAYIEMIADDKKIVFNNIGEKMHGLGTQEDLNLFFGKMIPRNYRKGL